MHNAWYHWDPLVGKANNQGGIQMLKLVPPDDSDVICCLKWALSWNSLIEKRVLKYFLETTESIIRILLYDSNGIIKFPENVFTYLSEVFSGRSRPKFSDLYRFILPIIFYVTVFSFLFSYIKERQKKWKPIVNI